MGLHIDPFGEKKHEKQEEERKITFTPAQKPISENNDLNVISLDELMFEMDKEEKRSQNNYNY